MLIFNNNQNFVYFFILILFICIIDNVESQQLWSQNGHTYQFISTPEPYFNALSRCASLKNGSSSGYLSTITSKEEMEFIFTTFQNRNISLWLSAEEQPSEGMWRYASGPELKSLLYSSQFDKCGYYCNFADDFRPVDPSETLLYYNGNDQRWRAIANSATSFAYICEFGGFEDPSLDQIGAVGGKTTMKRFTASRFNLNSLKITLVKVDKLYNPVVGQQTIQCTGVTLIGGSYYCTLPRGTGRYMATFTDGIQSTTSYFQYWTPTIMVTTPNFTANGVVTLSGTDFGFDPSVIQVWFGPAPNQTQCINIQFINNNAIICTLISNIQLTLLPINITVDGIEIISIRSSIYSKSNQLSYSCYDIQSAFDIGSTVASTRTFEGLTSSMAVIKDSTTANFLKSVCTATSMKPYLNALYTAGSSPPTFTYATGYHAGQALTLYQGNTLSNIRVDDRIYYDLRIDIVNADAKTIPRAVLIESEWVPSNAQVINGPYDFSNISTLSDIVISANYAGRVGSNVTLRFNGYIFQSTYIDYFTKNVYFTISGISGPYNLNRWLFIDGTPTNDGTTIKIDFASPFISLVSSPNTTGDGFTISGTNFGPFINSIVYNIDNGLTCDIPLFQKPHSMIACHAPPGYGSQLHSLRITVGNKQSNYIAFTYAIPTVDYVSTLGVRGGVLTIHGTNFYVDPSVMTVMVGPYQCVNISFTIPHSQITCDLPSGFGRHSVVVTVGDQPNDPNLVVWFTFIKPFVYTSTSLKFRQPGYVTIKGDNFDNVNLVVSFGGMNGEYPAVNSTLIDRQTIVTFFQSDVLPAGTFSLNVVVSINNERASAEVFLYEYVKGCLNDCSGHGTCIDAHCHCDDGYLLSDCSTTGNLTVPKHIGNTRTIFDMSAQEPGVSFTTAVTHLREVDQSNNTIQLVSLSQGNWTLVNNETTQPQQTWQQEWLVTLSPITNVSILLGYYDDQNGTSLFFFGETVPIPRLGVKYTVKVHNWQFVKTTNLLEVIFANAAKKETIGDCDQIQETQFYPAFNEYHIRTRRSALHTRFANRLATEIRTTYSFIRPLTDQPTIIDQVRDQLELDIDQEIYLTSLVVPWFQDYAVVDPTFQASFPKDTSSTKCPSSKKWVIPVAVVCSVVGAALIGISIWLIKRKVDKDRAERAEGIRLAQLYR